MNKEVLISISGFQYEIDQEEAVEVITSGTYYEKNGKHFVLYDEISEDSGKITKNTIKFEKEQLDIIKRGENNVHMVFQLGKEHRTCYYTPFGELLIKMNTTSISSQEEDEDSMVIKVAYDLNINHSHVSRCSIEIKIHSK